MKPADASPTSPAGDGPGTLPANPVPAARTAPDAETPPAGAVPTSRTATDAETTAPASPAPASPAPASPAPARSGDAALSEREREILAFEQQWWRHAGAKEQAIRDTFDISATRYYQILNGLLDNPAALAAAPTLVARLRRLRSTRSRNRRR